MASKRFRIVIVQHHGSNAFFFQFKMQNMRVLRGVSMIRLRMRTHSIRIRLPINPNWSIDLIGLIASLYVYFACDFIIIFLWLLWPVASQKHPVRWMQLLKFKILYANRIKPRKLYIVYHFDHKNSFPILQLSIDWHFGVMHKYFLCATFQTHRRVYTLYSFNMSTKITWQISSQVKWANTKQQMKEYHEIELQQSFLRSLRCEVQKDVQTKNKIKK